MKLLSAPARSRDLKRRVAVRWQVWVGMSALWGVVDVVQVPYGCHCSETQIADKKETHRSRTGASKSCNSSTIHHASVVPGSGCILGYSEGPYKYIILLMAYRGILPNCSRPVCRLEPTVHISIN